SFFFFVCLAVPSATVSTLFPYTTLFRSRGDQSVPECLAEGGSSQECGLPKDRFAQTNPLLNIDLPQNAHQVDVSQYVCPAIENPAVNSCDAIVGNIIVSYDSNHLTSVFSHTLAPAFETEMREKVGWLFE